MIRLFGRALAAREKRALAALAVAALLFALLDFIALPVVDNAGQLHAALPLKEKSLRKHQALIALAGSRETGWKGAQARLADAEKGLLESRTPALASAELQERVKQLLTQQELEARGATFLPVRPLGQAGSGYLTVPLSLTFECTVDQLANLLLAARADSKTLAVEQLQVDAAPSRPDRQKTVSVRLVVRGVMAAESAAPKS